MNTTLQALKFATAEATEGLDEVLEITIKGISNGELGIEINGKEYSYAPKDKSMTPEAMRDKFNSIKKHNPGRALSWLKQNAIVSTGSKKGPHSQQDGKTVKESADEKGSAGEEHPFVSSLKQKGGWQYGAGGYKYCTVKAKGNSVELEIHNDGDGEVEEGGVLGVKDGRIVVLDSQWGQEMDSFKGKPASKLASLVTSWWNSAKATCSSGVEDAEKEGGKPQKVPSGFDSSKYYML